MWQFISPKIFYGEDSLEYLEQIPGKKAFLITDEIMTKLGHVETVKKYLANAGIAVDVFDEVEQEPSFETVVRGRDIMMKSGDYDLIIGLGGGSPMDAAKAMRILYEMPEVDITDISPMMEMKLEKTKLILIPTTSGTGSEVTPAIVLTSVAEGRKAPTTHLDVGADYAIVDPIFVKDMPKPLIVNTGLDALTHAIDAYISSWKNEFSDGLSIIALDHIFKYLPRSYTDPEDTVAKEKMHIAASIAGLSFGNAQAGLSHGMGHSIGAVFHLPHGKACGISLPYTLQYEGTEAEEQLAELSRFLGSKNEGKEAVKDLITKINLLMDALDVPNCLKDCGITEEEFKEKLAKLVANANEDGTTATIPRMPSDEDFEKLFTCTYTGKPVDF